MGDQQGAFGLERAALNACQSLIHHDSHQLVKGFIRNFEAEQRRNRVFDFVTALFQPFQVLSLRGTARGNDDLVKHSRWGLLIGKSQLQLGVDFADGLYAFSQLNGDV